MAGNSSHNPRAGRGNSGGGGNGMNPEDRTEYFGSNDRTEYFGNEDRTQYMQGSQHSGGEARPRQYFPGEDQQGGYPQDGYSQGGYPQGGYAQGGYPQDGSAQPGYNQAGQEQAQAAPSSSGTANAGSPWQLMLGLISGLALVAAIVFFFLWRGAADEADQPAPEPVTESVTETEEVEVPVTMTEEVTVTETAPADDGESWIDQIPTEVPENLRPEDGEDFDLREWLSDLFG